MGKQRSLRLFLTGAGTLLAVIAMSPAAWAPAGASSANVSQFYHTSGAVTNGSLVSLDPKRSNYVEPANTDNGAQLLGVAVANNDSLLAVDSSNSSAGVQVATDGNALALVSTLNGDINAGDQIAVSPFNGVGMKALSGSRVIGLAQTSFNKASQGAVTQTVTGKGGQKASLQIGYIRVSIAIGTDISPDANLSSLQRLAKSLTGRTVSTLRVTMSLIVASVALAALVTLTYASIYGSIISVGRNPLAKYAIFRSLISVLALAAITATLAGLTIAFLFR